ncbi:MAG: TRAP transporter substrate-binding protein DctP [Thermoleophilia bacterium]|nr:TRAP transporter substrate-binding protein DctP [Thermoleophilia bacterium]
MVFGFAVGCGDDGETTETTGATPASEGAATTSAAVSEPIKLDKVTGASSANDPGFQIDEEVARRIEQESGGKVQITVHLAGTLCGPLEVFDATEGGIADIAGGACGWAPQRFGLTSFAGNCLHRLPSSEVATTVIRYIFDNTPEIQSEWADWKVLWFNGQTPGAFHLNKRAETMADLEGRQIRMPADQGVYGSALGATPVSLPISDMYSSLEKGIIDGAWCGISELKVLRLAEVAPFSLHIPISTGVTVNAMPIETWNSLPDDVKAAFESASAWAAAETAKIWDQAAAETYEWAETQGHELVEPAPDEMIKILEALYATDEASAKTFEEKGRAGTAVLNAARQAEEKFGDQFLWSDIWPQ